MNLREPGAPGGTMTDTGTHSALVVNLVDVDMTDVGIVGGKNASLGELSRNLASLHIEVPEGFATTAAAYWSFIQANALQEKIKSCIEGIQTGSLSLKAGGAAIRKLILHGRMPSELQDEITGFYGKLCETAGLKSADVAVRSSATAEDLPTASFAGQLESFLNIRGEEAVLNAVRSCFASLFTDRAISYREAQGFDHLKVAVSVGVQRMVRSDKAGSGVMFSIDTETGFPDVVVINAAWGLGEFVVKGIADPDEYVVFKPLLGTPRLTPILEKRLGAKRQKLVYARNATKPTIAQATSERERRSFVLEDREILKLAQWARSIESHYGRPMDIEWAKDGLTGKLFIVQARPETVQSCHVAGAFKTYRLKASKKPLLKGLAIGSSIAAGVVCHLKSAREADRFPDGAILVAEMTDPDWGPIMKRASAIVTAHGGRTSHAAIVSREMGLPAVVGAAGATHILKSGNVVTVSCAEGDEGFVYAGRLKFEETDLPLDTIPKTRTHVMLNVGDPAGALRWWRLPADGIGLARMEFIVSNHVKIHPMALVRFDTLRDAKAKRDIAALTQGYPNKEAYFIDRLAQGVSRIAASQYPRPVIVRMSDFKTNEYATLIGGAEFEPDEPNPMIGWRGASRYYDKGYREGFALECRAIKRVRDSIGLKNVVVMIPFCRTLEEADLVLKEMKRNGLEKGKSGLEVYVMCEIPSNVILAEQFAERFDGFSIGSNDLTQLTLGVDRDSRTLSHLFNEEDPAVKALIRQVIEGAHRKGAHVGLCGQAPSDRPAFARFLVEAGIDSISVTPDSFIGVKANVAEAERAAALGASSGLAATLY
ncbi:MAG TPA: phosphoenolpyruvate synthase [Micropepsaceae bacterium]|nr:phosphoenolpyruvate synthase [Micropepsaceae bacterium]